MRALLVGLAILTSGVVNAAEPWDAAVRRLCTSLDQQDCWVKSGAALCDREQISCKNLPDHAPAVIIGRSGKRWNVRTEYGSGWVSERLMMLDSTRMR